MKKIFYLALAISSAFIMQSCEPMEDIYKDLDANSIDAIGIKDLQLRLTTTDYANLKGVNGAGNSYKNNSFISEDTAKAFVPTILAKKYPYLGEKASILVTYDLGNVNTKLKTPVVATATNNNYESVTGGTRFQNFNSEAQVIAGARLYNATPVQGDVVKLTYKWASNTANDTTSNVLFLNNSWNVAYTLSLAEYKSMGQSYANFSTVATANSYLPVFVKNKYPYKTTEGSLVYIVWDLYSGVTTTSVTILKYVNGVWTVNNGTTEATLKFSKTNGVWVPDNTIKYTLTTDDHKYLSKFITDNENGKTNIASYGNFDLQRFKTPDIYKHLGAFLKDKYPTAAIGQKYLLTYKTYNPSANVDVHLILNANNEYEEVK